MIVSLIQIIFMVLETLIFVRIIMSWIMPQGNNEFARLVYSITEPMLKPFRAVIPLGNMGGIDISPIILIILLGVVKKMLILIFA